MGKTKEQREEYFDIETGKQIKPLPPGWLDLSKRFKIGDKIRYLGDNSVHIPCPECKEKSWFHHNGANRDRCEQRSMHRMIGVVLEVNQGDARCWPPRWAKDDSFDEGGVWLNQRAGWLTVQFPVSNHHNKAGEYSPLAMHIEAEGTDWEKVKHLTGCREPGPGETAWTCEPGCEAAR